MKREAWQFVCTNDVSENANGKGGRCVLETHNEGMDQADRKALFRL